MCTREKCAKVMDSTEKISSSTSLAFIEIPIKTKMIHPFFNVR
jgi:hypothetical protein